MQLDSLTITAIFSGVSALLGALLVKGVEAINRYRRQSSEICSLEDARADKAYNAVIRRFESRIESLEREIIDLRKALDEERRTGSRDREECARTTTRLEAELESLRRQVQSSDGRAG